MRGNATPEQQKIPNGNKPLETPGPVLGGTFVHLANSCAANKALDLLHPGLVAALDALPQVCNLEHVLVHLEVRLKETLVWSRGARVRLLPSSADLAGWRLCGRGLCRHSPVLRLHRTFLGRHSRFLLELDRVVGGLDCLSLTIRLDLDRELGSNSAGAGLDRTEGALCFLFLHLLLLDPGRFVWLVCPEGFERLEQDVMLKALLVEPLLACLVGAPNQDLVRISRLVALADFLDGL